MLSSNNVRRQRFTNNLETIHEESTLGESVKIIEEVFKDNVSNNEIAKQDENDSIFTTVFKTLKQMVFKNVYMYIPCDKVYNVSCKKHDNVCSNEKHDNRHSRNYYISNVLCQDCCKGYCEDCSRHNGHIDQLVNGSLIGCNSTYSGNRTEYRVNCGCKYDMEF